MRENEFQLRLIRKIKKIFPGCIVLKNDANYLQGIPDLLVLFKDRWAALEVKRGKLASHRPNQDYYVNKMRDMSYASFVYPENEPEVFEEMRHWFYGYFGDELFDEIEDSDLVFWGLVNLDNEEDILYELQQAFWFEW